MNQLLGLGIDKICMCKHALSHSVVIITGVDDTVAPFFIDKMELKFKSLFGNCFLDSKTHVTNFQQRTVF